MLEAISGEIFDNDLDREAAKCADELRPAIARLIAEGWKPGVIIAALARLTVFAVEQQRRN